MSNRGPHYFSTSEMTPDEVVWEPREVALPAWMWRCLDDLVERHQPHGADCYKSSADRMVAFGVRFILGDPAEDAQEQQCYSAAVIEGLRRTVVEETSKHPIASLAEYRQFYSWLVSGMALERVSLMTQEDMAVFAADAAIQLATALGHRLSLVEDINTAIRPATTLEQAEALREALERLGEDPGTVGYGGVE